MATTMVHIRVGDKVKEKAAKTLAEMGLSVSDAVRLLLTLADADKTEIPRGWKPLGMTKIKG